MQGNLNKIFLSVSSLAVLGLASGLLSACNGNPSKGNPAPNPASDVRPLPKSSPAQAEKAPSQSPEDFKASKSQDGTSVDAAQAGAVPGGGVSTSTGTQAEASKRGKRGTQSTSAAGSKPGVKPADKAEQADESKAALMSPGKPKEIGNQRSFVNAYGETKILEIQPVRVLLNADRSVWIKPIQSQFIGSARANNGATAGTLNAVHVVADFADASQAQQNPAMQRFDRLVAISAGPSESCLDPRNFKIEDGAGELEFKNWKLKLELRWCVQAENQPEAGPGGGQVPKGRSVAAPAMVAFVKLYMKAVLPKPESAPGASDDGSVLAHLSSGVAFIKNTVSEASAFISENVGEFRCGKEPAVWVLGFSSAAKKLLLTGANDCQKSKKDSDLTADLVRKFQAKP